MLTAIILVCLGYVALFAALWLNTRFLPRPGRTSRVQVVVTPYGRHVHLTAPSDSAAAEAFLRADLELAKVGK